MAVIQGFNQKAREQVQGVAVTPTLFIGLGGTGLKTLARFRRRLAERGCGPEQWPIFRFLGIDTEQKLCDAGGWEAGGRGLPLDPHEETICIGLTREEMRVLLDTRHFQKTYLENWLPANADQFGAASYIEGAGQHRAIGRLLFVEAMPRLKQRIDEQLNLACSDAKLQTSRANGAVIAQAAGGQAVHSTNVVIISSIAGGTGAGAFLDCAFLVEAIRSANQLQGMTQLQLLLPDVFLTQITDTRMRTRCMANGYAALREMEHWATRIGQRPFPVDGWPAGIVQPGQLGKDRPFSLCHFVSRSNGHVVIEKISDALDLVADALVFASVGDAMASHLRGVWSNSHTAYEQGIAVVAQAARAQDGGDPAAPEANLYRQYEKRLVAQYSSFGVSAVTMKLFELQHLGAVRTLISALGAEIGSMDESQASQADRINKAAELAMRVVHQRSVFSEAARKAMTEKIKQVFQSPDPNAGLAEWDRQKGRLHHIALGVRNPVNADESVIASAKDLVTRSKSLGATDAEAALGALSTWSFIDQVRIVASMRERIAADIATAAKENAAVPEATEVILWLDHWKALQAAGVSDLLGLGATAVTDVLRPKTIAACIAFSDRCFKCVDGTCREVYLAAVSERLNAERQAIGDRQRATEEIRGHCREEERLLCEAFNDARNVVVTKDFVDSPQFGREIDIALATKDLKLADGDFHLRRSILDRVGDRLQGNKAAYADWADFWRQQDEQSERAVAKLLDVIRDDFLKDRFPQTRDVYSWLDRDGQWGPSVTAAATRAAAYWPKTPGVNADAVAWVYRIAGGPTVTDPRAHGVRNQVNQFATANNWTWLDTGADGGSSAIVFVHESHGLPLASLQTLRQMRTEYDAIDQTLGGKDMRHLDRRALPELPHVDVSFADGTIARVIDAADYALLGVLTLVITWRANAPGEGRAGDGVFVYRQQNLEFPAGRDLRSVVDWLLEPSNEGYLKEVRRLVDRWFTDQVGSFGDTEGAATARDRLVEQSLILRLLGSRHPEFRRDADHTSGPGHTRTRRLQYKIRETLKALYAAHRALAGAEPQRTVELANDLARRLAMVGRRTVPEFGDMTKETGRIPRLLPKGRQADDDGRAVRQELWEMRWIDSPVAGLCPEYIDVPQDEERA